MEQHNPLKQLHNRRLWVFVALLLCALVTTSIFIYTNAAAEGESYIAGPSGGTGGKPFNDRSVVGRGKEVRSVLIRHGHWIDAIQVVYAAEKGMRHGGGGGKETRFQLEPGEYIKEISGRYERFVNSLRIITNRKSSQIYGGVKKGGANYQFQAPPGYEIAGFIGSSGKYLDSIGVVVRPR